MRLRNLPKGADSKMSMEPSVLILRHTDFKSECVHIVLCCKALVLDFFFFLMFDIGRGL